MNERDATASPEEVHRLTPELTSDDNEFDSVEEDEESFEFHDASPTKVHLLHRSAVEEIKEQHNSALEALTIKHMAEKVELSAAYNRDLEQAVEGATELEKDQRMLAEMHEEASRNYDLTLKQIENDYKHEQDEEMAVQAELQAELQASRAECATLQASLAQKERVVVQTRNELAEQRQQTQSERVSNQRLICTIETLEGELASLTAKRSMVHAVFAKLGDGDPEDDVLEAHELDDLLQVRSIIYAHVLVHECVA